MTNKEAVWGKGSEVYGDTIQNSEEADEDNVVPRGVQNVMLGEERVERADLNYFYNLQWHGQYYNSSNISPEFGSFLEDMNFVEEDQDELDLRGLIETPVEKSQEDVSTLIQIEPRLTSTTALPPLPTSELTSNIQESKSTSLQGEVKEKIAIHEPNQPPSPPQPASPLPQVSNYKLRTSSQSRTYEQGDGGDDFVGKSVGRGRGRGGRGRGRGRGGGGRGQKRKLDMMTYSAPSPADSVTSVGSGGGEFYVYSSFH